MSSPVTCDPWSVDGLSHSTTTPPHTRSSGEPLEKSGLAFHVQCPFGFAPIAAHVGCSPQLSDPRGQKLS